MPPLSLSNQVLSPDMMVAEVLETWPDLLPVFLYRRMACPGCSMAPFMTLHEAAQSHGLDSDVLMEELREALDGKLPSGPFLPPLSHGQP
ncbi:DUF1858 domain-containing protein [Telmatospirillum sp. J64-1]|uniref:DUF1858 domain-containing protein n=1 Tax=Telmatospirillum sp. J64-1 TaxID=2502183 RepID=UPI00115C6513|nr:DUF1858 domain-containing protein [Telmatospirillum sp. J64-1]